MRRRNQLLGERKKRWKDDEQYAQIFEAAAGSKSGEAKEASKRLEMLYYDGAAGYRKPESTHSSPRKPAHEPWAATHVGELLQGNALPSAQVLDEQTYKERFQGAAGARSQPVRKYHQGLPPPESKPLITPRKEVQPNLLEVIQQQPQDSQAQLQEKLERLQLQGAHHRQRFVGAHGVRPAQATSARAVPDESRNLRYDVGGPSSLNVGISSDPDARSEARLQLEAKLYEGRAGARSDLPSHHGIRIRSVTNASELDELLTGRDIDDSARRIAAQMRSAEYSGAAGAASRESGAERRIRRSHAPNVQSQVDELIWGHDIDGSGGHSKSAAIDSVFKSGKKRFPCVAANATSVGDSLTWGDELAQRPRQELNDLPPVHTQPKLERERDVIDELMAEWESMART